MLHNMMTLATHYHIKKHFRISRRLHLTKRVVSTIQNNNILYPADRINLFLVNNGMNCESRFVSKPNRKKNPVCILQALQ